jgi:hypothetical protein
MFAHSHKEREKHVARVGCRSRYLRILWLRNQDLTELQVRKWSEATYGLVTSISVNSRGACVDFKEAHTFVIGQQSIVAGKQCTVKVRKRRSRRRLPEERQAGSPQEFRQAEPPQEGSPPQAQPQTPLQAGPQPQPQPQVGPPPQEGSPRESPALPRPPPRMVYVGPVPYLALPPVQPAYMFVTPPPFAMYGTHYGPRWCGPPPMTASPAMVAPPLHTEQRPVSPAHCPRGCLFMRTDTALHKEPIGFWRRAQWFQRGQGSCKHSPPPLYTKGCVWMDVSGALSA